MPAAFGGQNQVIVIPRESFRVDNIGFRGIHSNFVSPPVARVFTMELGMKIGNIIVERLRVLLIVDIEVLAVGCITFVDEFDPCAAVKGHLQVAVKGASCIERVILVCRGRERDRIVGVNDFVAESKEVP